MLPDLSTTDLQTYRDSLLLRLRRGRDAVKAKEETGDVGEQYARWLDTLLGLLTQYEDALDRLADLGAPACNYAPCKAETCAECKVLPTDFPPDALGAAWRVALGAPYDFTEAAEVVDLARGLTIFAGSAPVLGLPIGKMDGWDEQFTYQN
ncbi:MAG: hypothetical protein FJZ90_08950 [Chloroflexi bacterium]|nr:hypothetical protein [Chloroflexota bacterium]